MPIRLIAMAIAAFAITSCVMRPDKHPDDTMSWDSAKAAILHGRVKKIVQMDGYIVILEMKNGSYGRAQSPRMDEVFDVLKACGTPCANVDASTD